MSVADEILNNKIVAVVRGFDTGTTMEIAEQLLRGGVRTVEITMDSPGADRSIQQLNREFDEVIAGAGTVRTTDDVEKVDRAGAKFALSPVLDPDVVRACQERDVLVVPGCLTPSEIMNAYKLGVRTVKLFPASNMGPDYLSSIRGPLPDVTYIPTGGISDRNAEAFFNAGAGAVGAGSYLTGKMDEEGVESVRERAETLRRAVRHGNEQG